MLRRFKNYLSETADVGAVDVVVGVFASAVHAVNGDGVHDSSMVVKDTIFDYDHLQQLYHFGVGAAHGVKPQN